MPLPQSPREHACRMLARHPTLRPASHPPNRAAAAGRRGHFFGASLVECGVCQADHRLVGWWHPCQWQLLRGGCRSQGCEVKGLQGAVAVLLRAEERGYAKPAPPSPPPLVAIHYLPPATATRLRRRGAGVPGHPWAARRGRTGVAIIAFCQVGGGGGGLGVGVGWGGGGVGVVGGWGWCWGWGGGGGGNRAFGLAEQLGKEGGQAGRQASGVPLPLCTTRTSAGRVCQICPSSSCLLQVLLMFGPEYARACGIAALEPLGIYLPGDKNYPGACRLLGIVVGYTGSWDTRAATLCWYAPVVHRGRHVRPVPRILHTPCLTSPQAAGCSTRLACRLTQSATSACACEKSRTGGWRWWRGWGLRRRRRPRGRGRCKTWWTRWRAAGLTGLLQGWLRLPRHAFPACFPGQRACLVRPPPAVSTCSPVV